MKNIYFLNGYLNTLHRQIIEAILKFSVFYSYCNLFFACYVYQCSIAEPSFQCFQHAFCFREMLEKVYICQSSKINQLIPQSLPQSYAVDCCDVDRSTVVQFNQFNPQVYIHWRSKEKPPEPFFAMKFSLPFWRSLSSRLVFNTILRLFSSFTEVLQTFL